ncbi:MAG: PAS domain S-box protein [Bacteroidetes bacterium]|nr:PAS domain S-box protein [Bacteroidota bacterium]
MAATLKHLMDSLSDAIISTDRSGIIRNANAAARRYVGESFVGVSLSSFIEADSREQFAAIANGLVAEPAQIELSMQSTINGLAERVVISTALPFDLDVDECWWLLRKPGAHMMPAMQGGTYSAAVGSAGTFGNEGAFRSLIEHIPDITWTIRADGSMAFISSRIEEVLGYTPDNIYALGADICRQLIHPDHVAEFMEAHHRLFEHNQAYNVEFRIRNSAGSYVWVHSRAIMTYQRDGVLHADGVCTDITQRKQLEEALRNEHDVLIRRMDERSAEVSAMAERTRRSQVRFVAHASHDLLTPLTVVRAELELLKQSTVHDDETREALNRIDMESRRLDHLTKDLLLLATLDSLDPQVDFRPTRLDELVLNCLADSNELANEKGLMWNVQFSETPEVLSAPNMVQRAIANVLDNAVKYSPVGGAITVRVMVKDRRACIIVEDAGSGIGADPVEQLFERFYRGDGARSTIGSGLGLSIVKSVADAHGGEVIIEPLDPVGTRVSIALPS